MRGCDCPQTEPIGTIPLVACKFNIDQIQKVVFQLRGNTFLLDAIKLEASWTPLLTATDNTKVTSTPILGANPLITPGGAISEGGGDNSTMNGKEVITGTNPSLFTADFRNMAPSQEKAIKSLMCFEGMLQVYFITRNNQILVSQLDLDVDTSHKGFDIDALYLSDRDTQGFGKDDMHKLRFSLNPGWSEDIVLIDATDFSPLSVL